MVCLLPNGGLHPHTLQTMFRMALFLPAVISGLLAAVDLFILSF